VGTRDLRPAGKGWKKKKQKNPGINPGSPPEKGEKKKKNPLVLTLGSPPKKGGKKNPWY
jgi:hypothetical protein